MKVAFTNHAVDRYIERVKPHLDRGAALAELRRLTAMIDAPLDDIPPRLILEDEADSVCEISPGIWLLLVSDGPRWYRAVSCIGNAGFSDETRARRNAKKARKRRARKARAHRRDHRPQQGWAA